MSEKPNKAHFNNYYLQISISSYVVVFIEEIVYRVGMFFVQILMSLYILIVLKNPPIAVFALLYLLLIVLTIFKFLLP